ncbi:L-aspartate oxidase [Natranaerobius trueperi]|uniref:L-aspartate oxidase n=1 Tax=Natranaerobius trueperi TaxID=759412 RepID=A0A226C1W6_9FIRM|nr:L-aspartate oxidase [Natranaerobius trueperi]OWZ84370.1 L-aspartate oxidase [Natranaerobius trueperi]
MKPIIRHFPVLVLGSGIAGMCAASEASKKIETALVTKQDITGSNTYLAQGGIAAAVTSFDSPSLHQQDTLNASSGLSDIDIVKSITEKAPETITSLQELGVSFDSKNNEYQLGREGAHSKRRILKCGGDRTGKFISKSIQNKINETDNLTTFYSHSLLKLLIKSNICVGALTIDDNGLIHIFFSEVTILATGGYSALFENSSNNEQALGVPIGEAILSGVQVSDLEFIQFHPTAFKSDNKCYLISEAVRGEGGLLKDQYNNRIMEHVHPMKELAPRDIVAATIYKNIKLGRRVYLDASHMSSGFVKDRFPGITEMLEKYNLDLATDKIPITPSAHYSIGGVSINKEGVTNIHGLLAVGEVSASGFHGANRLASNSLLEGACLGLVTGKTAVRINKTNYFKKIKTNVRSYMWDKYSNIYSKVNINELRLDSCNDINEIQKIMWDFVGVIRDEEKLKQGNRAINEIETKLTFQSDYLKELSPLTKIITLAKVITKFSLNRKETRGVHRRKDYPNKRKKYLYRQTYNHKKGWLYHDNDLQRLARSDN